jgi:16S rRNA (uracil1498-N3)-methyltransferase
MPRFFVAASNIFGGVAYLGAEDAGHFKALRINRGECITVCDGAGNDYTCRVTDVTGAGAEAEIVSVEPSASEPTVKCTVYAALSKGDKLDTVVRKSVELGACEIVVFPSERCVARPDGAALIKRLQRLNKIAFSAAEQSERGIVPQVLPAPSFPAAMAGAASAELPLSAMRRSGRPVCALRWNRGRRRRPSPSSRGRRAALRRRRRSSRGLRACARLPGPRILRCETAPLAALSAVMLFTGNL